MPLQIRSHSSPSSRQSSPAAVGGGDRQPRSNSRTSPISSGGRSATPSPNRGRTDPPRAPGASQFLRRFAGVTILSHSPRLSFGGGADYVFTWSGAAILAADVLVYDAGYRLNAEKQGDRQWLNWLLVYGPDLQDKQYVGDNMEEWKASVRTGWKAATNAHRGCYPAVQLR